MNKIMEGRIFIFTNWIILVIALVVIVGIIYSGIKKKKKGGK
ncbi:unnamed protein product [marine sediment metagenome]|uniref:Uncharacterized protein n=1 Tax=marine sediment metagenome TaxID=412755 RepID=X1UFF8_9ZZZZ